MGNFESRQEKERNQRLGKSILTTKNQMTIDKEKLSRQPSEEAKGYFNNVEIKEGNWKSYFSCLKSPVFLSTIIMFIVLGTILYFLLTSFDFNSKYIFSNCNN